MPLLKAYVFNRRDDRVIGIKCLQCNLVVMNTIPQSIEIFTNHGWECH